MDPLFQTSLTPAERFNRIVNSALIVVCPCLGYQDDRSMHARYTSRNNLCFCDTEPFHVRSSIQQIFCLTEGHVRCPLYLVQAARRASDELPDTLQNHYWSFLTQIQQD